MDSTSHAIATQVSFKGAIDNACVLNINLGSDAGQAWFEETFSYLVESLHKAIEMSDATAQVIQAFPGTQVVSGTQQMSMPNQNYQVAQPATPAVLPVRVKGNQFGPLPDWLLTAASEKGVNEVYDNRDRAMGTKRPWFKATTGGDNAVPFWPPRDS